MLVLPFVFFYLFVKFSVCFHGTSGIVGLTFGFQKLCFCRCGVAHRPAGSAPTHRYPWLVGVGGGGGVRLAGALLSERHVLTVANPLHGLSPSSLTVTLGAHDRCGGGASLNSSVAAILLHPAYSAGRHDNDVALLRLRHAAPYGDFIAPICLPLFASEDFNKVVSVAGWSRGELGCTARSTTLPLLPPRACAAAGPAADAGCLGPVGARNALCETEAGAPVMARWSAGGAYRLLGILHPAADCAQPAVFTRVSDHVVWIRREIREDCQCF